VKLPRTLTDVFERDHNLSRLVQRTRELQSMNAALREKLGLALGDHLQVATINDQGALVLIATSPAWVVRARYLVPELLAWAKNQPLFDGVTTIQVQVERVGRGPVD
jgi:hypothetical protein